MTPLRLVPRGPALLATALLSALAPAAQGQDPGPASALERFSFTEVHMAVPVRIVLYAPGPADARHAARSAYHRMAELERVLSDYRVDSELRRVEGRAGDWTEVSPELLTVLEASLEMARLSDGAFDPTVGPLVELWREARSTGRLPGETALDAARALTGWEKVELDPETPAVRLTAPGMRLDLGGIAKGFILDEALDVLRARGAGRALIEAGGDIRVGDAPPGLDGWEIETPAAGREVGGRTRGLANGALATSAPTAQFLMVDGIRYSHVVDPRTGRALTNEVVATVVAPTAMLADVLATSLTVLGPEEGRGLAAHFPEAVVSVRAVAAGLGLPPEG